SSPVSTFAINEHFCQLEDRRPTSGECCRSACSDVLSRKPSLAPCVTRRVIGDGAAEALGIHPRPIEAAGASLPVSEHIAGTLDPLQARLFPLGGLDPLDPIPARDGRD